MSYDAGTSATLAAEDERYLETWRQVGQPTEHHTRLSALEGEWEFVTRWYRDASAEPRESRGTTTVRSVFGGRFLEEQARGKLLDREDYEGRTIIGYDYRRRKFFTAYYDNFQTALIVSEGDWPEGSQTLNLRSSHHVDTLTGAHDGEGAHVTIQITGPNRRTLQILEWTPDGHQQYVATEIEYTRVGGASS